jgi:hypothetical protein
MKRPTISGGRERKFAPFQTKLSQKPAPHPSDRLRTIALVSRGAGGGGTLLTRQHRALWRQSSGWVETQRFSQRRCAARLLGSVGACGSADRRWCECGLVGASGPSDASCPCRWRPVGRVRPVRSCPLGSVRVGSVSVRGCGWVGVGHVGCLKPTLHPYPPNRPPAFLTAYRLPLKQRRA